MTAYGYPGSASSYSPVTSGDPTAVFGRRIGAWVVDVVLFMLLMAFFGPSPLNPLAEYYTEDELPSDDCGYVLKLDDVANCFDIGDRFYVTDSTETAIQAAVGLAWFLLIMGALQGIKGVTPGKALFGIKVVDERGGPPGFGRAIVRTVLWIVDSAPWCLPLVGFVTGLTAKGHRRVGDMAAKTFVVDRSHTGPVLVPGMVTAAGGYGAGPAWAGPPPGAAGGPPSGWGAPPQSPPPGTWGSRAPGGAPPAGPPGPATGEDRPGPPAGWTPPRGAWPGPEPSGAPDAAAPQPASTEYSPQWDAARGTYIVWEPNRGMWLGWDEAAQQWKPL